MKRVIGGLFLALLSVMWLDGAMNPKPTDNQVLFAFLGTAAAIGGIYCFIRQLSIWNQSRNSDNRFYGALALAAWERLGAYRLYKTHQAIKVGEREDDWTAIPLEELLPWEDEKYAFVSLGQVDQNDFYIETSYGVTLKEFGVQIRIDETYDCENMKKRYEYLIADHNFQPVILAYSTGYS